MQSCTCRCIDIQLSCMCMYICTCKMYNVYGKWITNVTCVHASETSIDSVICNTGEECF